jgi:deoxyadenosine/deoxycytidine kinase
MRPIIGIEGIIGCGKSTLAEQISKELNFRLLSEPVESNHYLEIFYRNPKKYAFPMQIELLYRRYCMHQLACYESLNIDSPYNGVVMDRTLQGDWVFAQLHTEAGNIEPIMMETYNKTCDIMSSHMKEPTTIIFLDVKPEVAMERVLTRQRKSELINDEKKENLLSLDYLFKLDKTYKKMLDLLESKNHRWSYGTKNIYRVNWNEHFSDVKQILQLIGAKHV